MSSDPNIPAGDYFYSAVGTAINNTTAISLIGAAGAGFQYFLTQVEGANLSTAVDTLITIFDGTSERDVLPLRKGSENDHVFPGPGLSFTAGAAITIQSQSAADARFSLFGYKKRV